MLAADIATTLAPATLPESPFRGIEPFRFVDQPIFFARSEETQRLLRYVSVYRGVLFYGESGCGKSSLINAGFIPAIIAEGFTPDRLRVQPKPGEEIVVERISTSDTGEPPYLPSNFIGPDRNSARIVLSVDQLSEQLHDLREARRPLLVFDQFEEFATLFEDAPRGEALERAQLAQQAILKLIVDLQRDAKLPVKLLFSFREDYLAKLSKLVALWPDLSDQSLRLTAPGREALPTIIRGSFEKYPGSFGKELSASLTNELVTALDDRNEGAKLNLSEVQIACLQLWKAKDPESLFKEKSVQGLLEDYLSESLNRLPENLRDPAIALLSRMVTPSGTRNIVSEYDLISQVFADEGIPENRLKEACYALVQKTRLVRRERRYDTYFYEIVSEFLVPWISRQKAERIKALERKKLEAIEKKKRNRAFALAAASLVLALGIGVVGLLIIKERNNTIRSQQKAGYLETLKNQEVQKAREEVAQAQAQKDTAEKDKIMAQTAYLLLQQQKSQGDAEAKKQYDLLNTQYQTVKNEMDPVTLKLKQLQEQVTQAKNGLDDALGDVDILINRLVQSKDPVAHDAVKMIGPIQNQLRKTRDGLRTSKR